MHGFINAKQALHHGAHHLHAFLYQKTRIRILIEGPSNKSTSSNPELPLTENNQTVRSYTTMVMWIDVTSILDKRSLKQRHTRCMGALKYRAKVNRGV